MKMTIGNVLHLNNGVTKAAVAPRFVEVEPNGYVMVRPESHSTNDYFSGRRHISRIPPGEVVIK